MAKTYIKAEPIHIGGVQAAKTALAGNKMFNEADWNSFIAQDRINEYITVLNEFDKNVDFADFNNKYNNNLQYLSGEEKVLAMENELWSDRDTVVEKTKTFTDADGKEVKEKFNTTEYDYTKSLLENKIAIKKAEKLQYEKLYLDEMRDSLGNALKAIPHKMLEGAINIFGGVGDLITGTSNYFNALTGQLDGYVSYDLQDADRAFRDAFTQENWDEELIDWLNKTIFLYEEGDYADGLAKYTASMAYSFGQILPSIGLNWLGSIIGKAGSVGQGIQSGLAKTAQVTYYTAMGANNLKELLNDPTMTTRPTLELIANAGIKTALERSVEIWLDKAFGTTVLDNMMYGAGLKSTSTFTTKNALMRIAKDAFQEGLEEYFQDFSGFMVDRVMSLWANDYAKCSDWTFQGAADAFVLGAVMSLGGSIIKVATTKGQVIGGKLQNKFVSAELKTSFDELYREIGTIDMSKMDAQQQISVVGEVFTMLRAITAINAEFGEERIRNAEKILTSIKENYGGDYATDAIQQILLTLGNEIKSGKTALFSADKYKAINIFRNVLEAQYVSYENVEAALNSAKLGGKVIEITKNESQAEIKEKLQSVMDNPTDEQVATINKMLLDTEKNRVFVTEQGIAPVEAGNSIVAPMNCVNAFTADTNIRTLSEQKVIGVISSDPEIETALADIRKIVKKGDGSEYTTREFVTLLLYDENFAYNVLYNGDKQLVSLISKLDSIVQTLTGINRYENITAKDIELIKERLHKVLYNYYRGVPFISQNEVEQSTILSKDEKLQLRAENWQRGIYHKVVDERNLPSDKDLKVLDTMVNSYRADQDTKQQMLDNLHSGSIEKIVPVMTKLKNQFYVNFQGKFNGKIYAKYDGNPANALFNTFLINNHITIDRIIRGDVDTDVAFIISQVSADNSVSPKNVLKFYDERLQDQFGYKMVPDYKNGTISIKETTASSYGNKSNFKTAKDYADTQTDRDTSQISVETVVKSDNLKYDIVSKEQSPYVQKTATIDDVIKDNRLLNPKLASEIRKKYGDTSPMHTFVYLREYILKQSKGSESIVIDQDGNYYINSIEGSKDVLTSNTKEAFDKKVYSQLKSLETQEDFEIDIADFVNQKFLDGLGKGNKPRVYVEAMGDRPDGKTTVIDRTTNGAYDKASNTIVINSNAEGFNYEAFIWTLMHEFKHCLQYHNNFDAGSSGSYIADIAIHNETAAKAIVQDMRKHYPTLFKNIPSNDFAKNVKQADGILYMSSTGEASSFGYSTEYDNKFNIYPVVHKYNNDGEITAIVTPWGAKYTVNGVTGVTKTKVSKSMRVDTHNRVVMEVHNVYNIPKATTEYINRIESDVKSLYDYQVKLAADIYEIMKNPATRDAWFNKRAQNIMNNDDTELFSDASVSDLYGVKQRWDRYDSYNSLRKDIMRMYPDKIFKELSDVTVPVITVVAVKNGRTDRFVGTNVTSSEILSSIKECKLRGYDKFYVGKSNISAATLWANVVDFTGIGEFYLYRGIVPNGIDVELRPKEVILSDTYNTQKYAADTQQHRVKDIESTNHLTGAIKRELDHTSIKSVEDVHSFANSERGIAFENSLYQAYDLPYEQDIFHKKFVEYLENVCELNNIEILNKYMWDSGYMSASDPRRKGKTSPKQLLADLLASEQGKHIRTLMFKVANFEIAPWLSYGDFLKTELPFVRITSQTEIEPTAFSGASIGASALFVQKGLSDTHTPLKLYIGSIKPKDMIGYITSNELEGLLPSSVVQLADKYTVVLQDDNKMYLLGEEFGNIDDQIQDVKMVSKEGKLLDTRLSFSKRDIALETDTELRRRLVSATQAKGTRMEHLVKPNTVLQLDPKIQDVYLDSDNVWTAIDPEFRKLLKGNKPIGKVAIGNYMKEVWGKWKNIAPKYRTSVRETFQLLNRNYFKNPNIPNLDTLQVLVKHGNEMFYAVRSSVFKRIDELNKQGNYETAEQFKKILYRKSSVQDLVMFCQQYEKSYPSDVAGWRETYHQYRFYNLETLPKIEADFIWFAYMNKFDGSLYEAGRLASYMREKAIAEKQNYWKKDGNKKKKPDADKEISPEENIADKGINNISGIVTQETMYTIVQEYVEHSMLDGKLFKSRKVSEIRQEVENILETMSDKEIEATFHAIEQSADLGIPVDISRFENIALGDFSMVNSKSTIKSLADKTRRIAKRIQTLVRKADFKQLVKDYPNSGFDENGNWMMPTFARYYSTTTESGLNEILLKRQAYLDDLQSILEKINSAKYGTKTEQKIINNQQQKIKKLEHEVEKLTGIKKKLAGEQKVYVRNDIGSANASQNKYANGQSSEVPSVLRDVFDDTGFERINKTQVKNLSEPNEVHFERNYNDFVSQNSDTLKGISNTDVDDILDFYEAVSIPPSDDSGRFEQFNAIRQYMLMYIYKLHTDKLLVLSDETLKRIERMFKTIKSDAGTELAISKLAEKVINPIVVICKSVSKQFGIEVDENLVDDLQSVIKKDYTAEAQATGNDANVLRVEAVERILQQMEQDTIAKINEQKAKGEWKNSTPVDTIIKWQRTMMLSGIGTWVRNKVSNVMLDVGNRAGEAIGSVVFGALNKQGSKFKRNVPDDQYKIIGTKLDANNSSDAAIIDWIDREIRHNGMFELMIEASTKYDASSGAHKHISPSAVIAELITRNAMSKFTNGLEFEQGNHWWTKAAAKGGNSLIHLLYGYTDANGKVHEGMLSDKKAITKSFYSFLGKMLKEDVDTGRITQADLNKGLNSRAVLDVVANAYVQASWDYMHRSNFFTKFDSFVREHTGDGGYFLWKQIEPFAASGWNWFVKSLEYNPIGLAKAIYDYARLEKTIAKMANAKVDKWGKSQVAPTSRLATYLIQRRIGNGIIGTIGCIAGALLAGFGCAGIDDEDGTPKLYIGNLSIDISGIFGTSGILSGIAVAGAFIQGRDNDNSWFEAVLQGMLSSFDTMFNDSVFDDVFDLMQSRETFAGVLVNKTGNVLSSFVPNLVKSAMNYTTVVSPKYATGILGNLEKQLVRTLPYVAYFLPKRYDIYTGELQFKNNMPWMDRWFDAVAGTLTNFATPLKVKLRTTSELEKQMVSLGISKGELTGNYSDIGQLSTKQVGEVNEYYGTLNNSTLTAFIKGKSKYTVENEQGKRVTLTYSQMNSKQKKNVVSRIMSNNAKYAKIYVATKSGWKYYADDTLFKELRRLGINNVYIETTKKQGFVK